MILGKNLYFIFSHKFINRDSSFLHFDYDQNMHYLWLPTKSWNDNRVSQIHFMEFQTSSRTYEWKWDDFTCAFEVSLGLSLLLSSAAVGGGWAGLLIDIGVVDTSRASNGGSGALRPTTTKRHCKQHTNTHNINAARIKKTGIYIKLLINLV